MFRRSSRTSRTSKTNRPEQADLTRRVARDRVHQVFGPNVSPALTVNRGETIVVETQDCYRGLLTEEPDTHAEADGTGGIPVTGPIYVEEAHIGDVLSIQVKEIKTSNTGVFAVRSETGVPGQDIRQPDVRVLEVDENNVKLDDRLALPVRPVIGNLGVATKHGEIETAYPGRHGGNMDTLEITTGSRVFLPVQVNGALLSLGDVKACMGDGQIAGSGVEVAAEVTIRVDTQPGGRFSWPRVESKGEWITITSASTVDQAARLAITEMVKWISQDKGLDFDTAYALVSLGGGLRVSQWGNPLTTARMVFPKRLINKIKSVPTASGRLNYRTLPPAANGDTGGEPVAAEAKPAASRSSSRSGSGRSQRSSGRSRQSGSRRGERQRTNGAAAPEAGDTDTQQESVQPEEAAIASDGSDKGAAADREKSDGKNSRASRGNGHGRRASRTRRGRDAGSKKDTAEERTESQAAVAETAEKASAGDGEKSAGKPSAGDSQPAAAETSGPLDGQKSAGKPSAGDSQKSAGKPSAGDAQPAAAETSETSGSQPAAAETSEPSGAQPAAAETSGPSGAQPAAAETSETSGSRKSAAKRAASSSRKSAAKRAASSSQQSAAKPAAGDGRNASDESAAVTEPPAQPEKTTSSRKEESKTRSGPETEAPAPKPAFGRRQRTVRRA